MRRLFVGMAAAVTMLSGTVVTAQTASAVPLCNPGGGSDGRELTLACTNSYPGLQWEVKIYCPGDPGHRESSWRWTSRPITMSCPGLRYVSYSTRWA